MTSFWLQQALADDKGLAAPPLAGDIRADVAIVGGGYTGLWTAIELKERDPSLHVVLIEKDICGAGASGANAGFLVSLWLQVELLQKLAGAEEASRLCRAADDAIAEIPRFASKEGFGIDHNPTGAIWGATCEAQSGHWHGMIDMLEKRQVHLFDILDREEITRRTGSRAFVAGVFDRSNALIHPGRLVRGLRRAALKRGVVIYEGTRMVRLDRGRPPKVVTQNGTITAKKVVLGLYGWSMSIPELAPSIMVIGTDAAMTEPIPDALQKAGWADGPPLMDSRIFVSGWRTTADGRVMWTKAGGVLPYGDRLDPCFPRIKRSETELRTVLRRIHPTLADKSMAGTWAGPIDRSKDGLPMFGRLAGHPDILFGHGYSGSGIVLARLGSRMLASLALETDDEWSKAALVRQPLRGFPPEPFRYVGGRMVRAAIERQDRLEHEGKSPGPLTRALVAMKPASYKPT